MTGEFRKWPESYQAADAAVIGKAAKVAVGVDVGTTSTQAAVLADGILAGFANIRTGSDFRAAAEAAIEKAIGDASAVKLVAATGFGRKNVPNASMEKDEVACIAKGARFMFGPSVHTVADLGGQMTKAISLYDWDRVRSFKVHDKCATGFGRHIEVVSEILRVPLVEMGAKSLEVENDPEPVSTTCYNFAFPETVGLFTQGYKDAKYTENDVIATHLFTVAWRILGTLGKLAPLDIGDIKLEEGVAFVGGLAKNIGITKRLERELGITALTSEYDPQLAAAIGAALLA